RKQTYQVTEGYSDSGRFLNPMRFINPNRSKTLQDRKGWVEGWEAKIKADEFIHGLGIGEAYMRHNGKPAKVKLVYAEINPPESLVLSEELPRFAQGTQKPLNLTEKVNQEITRRMQQKKRPEPKTKPKYRQEPTTAKKREPKQPAVAKHEESANSSPPKSERPSEQRHHSQPTHEERDDLKPKGRSQEQRDRLVWWGTWGDD
ncbi:MAG: hypothetical protein HYS58_03585, partial [Elusimicrobia bacterium]|nr:hypothetical protein [Elusimicrobiota bacterium]